jgi:hypothetical protein
MMMKEGCVEVERYEKEEYIYEVFCGRSLALNEVCLIVER